MFHYFIKQKTRELKLAILPSLALGAIDRLMNYNWQGNVRELENIVERVLIRHRDGFLTFDNLVLTSSKHDEIAPMAYQTVGILKLDEINALHVERVTIQFRKNSKNYFAIFLNFSAR